MRVLGIDGWRGGWVGVVLDGTAVVGATVADVVGQVADVAVVGIDIPIGLVDKGHRPCDLAARRLLGRRASTVFLTPPRAALEAPTYAEALTIAGVSKQAYGLRRRIFEVEAWCAGTDLDVREVHPEVSFAEMAGRVLLTSKHTPEGLAERRAALQASGIEPPEVARVPEADVLDAAAVAWTARRVAAGTARPLPDPPVDGCTIWA
jgi:predicted RNase H-like nuclease